MHRSPPSGATSFFFLQVVLEILKQQNCLVVGCKQRCIVSNCWFDTPSICRDKSPYKNSRDRSWSVCRPWTKLNSVIGRGGSLRTQTHVDRVFDLSVALGYRLFQGFSGRKLFCEGFRSRVLRGCNYFDYKKWPKSVSEITVWLVEAVFRKKQNYLLRCVVTNDSHFQFVLFF